MTMQMLNADFGYIAGSAPGNYLLTRFPTVLVVTASTVIWGALLIGQMGCHQPGQVMAIRFLLGGSALDVSELY